MIRTVALVIFGLALASATQAMPVSPMHKPHTAITQARMACGVGRGTIPGACQSKAGIRQERRAMRWCKYGRPTGCSSAH